MSALEPKDATAVQFQVPAWMIQVIRAALLTSVVEISSALSARVYVSPSEKRAFEAELVKIADVGALLDEQLARQDARHLLKH